MPSLSYNGSTVELSEHMLWSDEFAWSPVQQSTERSISGELHIDVSAAVGGRPITLESGADFGWLTRAECQVLDGWRAVPGAVMQLSLRGVTKSVLFDHERGGLGFVPVSDFADPLPSDWCALTLKFIEVV